MEVKFCVLDKAVYNPTLKQNVVSSTPVRERIEGTFEEITPTLESEIINAKESDRVVRYRIIAKLSDDLLRYVKSGAFIQVTHTKHLDTRSWREESAPRQYYIPTVSSASPTTRLFNIGLTIREK